MIRDFQSRETGSIPVRDTAAVAYIKPVVKTEKSRRESVHNDVVTRRSILASSSIGRVPDSESGGCRFESCLVSQTPDAKGVSRIREVAE